jgi:signal transduction histidine kinase/purine-cytosine permease-like protein/FixJ family two-component response regulator
MAAKQQIFRVRRRYNQWVNNQTLEDYALRFTAKASRRWSLGRVANTALGAISFLALEAIGAAITISYGYDNAVAAILVVGVLIFFAGLPICYYAAKYGVDIDLLTRGAGFGYIGSTATSLIYASFTFIFFALEAAIMAKALELVLGIPLAYGYILSSVVVIPLVFYGITFISRFQRWTQPFWIVLQLLPFIFILFNDASLISDWQAYSGTRQTDKGIDLLLFGAAASVMFSLMAQIGEQVDFLRFLPEKNSTNRFQWWSALILAGPGWIIIGCIKLLMGSFLAVVAMRYGLEAANAADPTMMYTVAFGFITDNGHLALILAGIFVVISQLKINVTNAYAGSIAWSNFFSRLTHNHPGRVVWLVFNVAIALLLMELGIYHTFESTLSMYAIVAVSWVGALVADLVINKPLGLSPTHIEFKRAHLYDINPVGVGSMAFASIIGIVAYLGFFGEYSRALAHFIALIAAFVIAPLIAWLTQGKYYIARQPYKFNDKQACIECSICQNLYENEDMAMCPAYGGYICSLCCSLDARCQDSCKTTRRIGETFLGLAHRYLPGFATEYINIRLIHFSLLLSVVAAVTGLLLLIIYINIRTENIDINLLIETTLWKVFFILIIVEGVICWLFVLARQSQLFAQQESQIQTGKLIDEIEAHEKTDHQLQIAKEQADAANNAKSRYLTGISHELRSPLNTVLGYAQLLEMDDSVTEKNRDRISVIRRSSEHLADLIEGLLDISKIEAGRLEIQRNPINFQTLLYQIEQMFRREAENKGLIFTYESLSTLPDTVMGDEKRLRQILINLLTNAIKYTEEGTVSFFIKYRNQVAEFKVVDTGVGIHDEDFERIFGPFERVRRPGNPAVPGTGLGLTITRLLADIMGGDICVEKNPEGGSIFTVCLMLSRVDTFRNEHRAPRKIFGYQGNKRSVMVVDDDATHRGLISDLLIPLNFVVVEAHDAEACFDMIKDFTPDIFLVDRQMPGLDGPQLAKALRRIGFTVPILMVTANANEDTLSDEELSQQHFSVNNGNAYNDYLIKPIRLDYLLKSMEKHLGLDWYYTPKNNKQNYYDASGLVSQATSIDGLENSQPYPLPLISKSLCEEIIYNAEIGHLSGLQEIAKRLNNTSTVSPIFVAQFNRYLKEVRLNKIIELLQSYK